jgi:hypothetical protein
MSDLNPRKYSPAAIDTLLARAPKELLEAALGGLNLVNEMLAGGTAPEPCIETVIDLLRNNAEIRVGKHTLTRPSDIIEYMGSKLGMCLAVLAALVTNPPQCPFSGQPTCPVEPPPPAGENPLRSN